jgi:D-alanyl-D-alanine carboxypeptidase
MTFRAWREIHQSLRWNWVKLLNYLAVNQSYQRNMMDSTFSAEINPLQRPALLDFSSPLVTTNSHWASLLRTAQAFTIQSFTGQATPPHLGTFQNVVAQPSEEGIFRGTSKTDLLLGQFSNDHLFGQSGTDLLIGGSGNDTLAGGTGKDLLLGGQGDDLLVDDYDGGDIMTGGKGNDIFAVGHWGNTTAPNLITDFAVGTDKIKVARLGATFVNLSIQDSDRGAVIIDNTRQIAILSGVKAANLQPSSFMFGDLSLANQLQTNLANNISASATPGATEAIITPDGFTWQGAAGFSNLASQTPMQTDDILKIASITKSFTAATVLKLAETGILRLDDPLGKWRPDIGAQIPDGNNITLRQLLNGTSGIPDFASNDQYFADAEAELYSGSPRQFMPEDIIAYIYGLPRYSGPRSSPTWAYPNTGNAIIYLVVEKATGKPFSQVVREQVLEPLGLSNTFLNGKEPIRGKVARGYDDYLTAENQPGTDGVLDDITDINPTLLSGAEGGLVSTSQDVARFMQALFGGELLQPQSQRELRTFVPAEGNQFGLGVVSADVPGVGPVLGTSGDLPGYGSQAFYLPGQRGAVFSTIINRSNVADPNNPNQRPVSSILRSSLSTVLPPTTSQPSTAIQ